MRERFDMLQRRLARDASELIFADVGYIFGGILEELCLSQDQEICLSFACSI
jgi:hypothetical protein